MAQSKSFFGIRRGQAMGMVFSKGQNGDGKAIQITRALPESVKNPRTAAQMLQRGLMSSVMKSYAFVKVLADHSMEGKSYGQQSMSEFLRINYAAAQNAAANAIGFAPYGSQYPTVFEGCQLAKGSLPSVSDLINYVDYHTANIIRTESLSEVEFASLLGLKSVDDVFTAVFVVVDSSSLYTDDFGLRSFQSKQLAYARIRMRHLPTDVPVAESFLDLSDSQYVNVTFEDGGVISFDVQSPIGGFGEDARIQLVTAVISNKTANGWLRSDASFRLFNDDPNETVNQNETTKSEALSTFPIGGEKILNGAGMTRATAPTVRIGAYQITESASPNRGEYWLGVEVDGVNHLVASVSGADVLAVKLGDNLADASLTFTPTPLTAESRFSTSTDLQAEINNPVSLETLYGYIAAGFVTNLQIGATSPVAASTLPILNSMD